MTERRFAVKSFNDKNCGWCNHFQIDGMFGRWCDKGHNWRELEYCDDWER